MDRVIQLGEMYPHGQTFCQLVITHLLDLFSKAYLKVRLKRLPANGLQEPVHHTPCLNFSLGHPYPHIILLGVVMIVLILQCRLNDLGIVGGV